MLLAIQGIKLIKEENINRNHIGLIINLLNAMVMYK